jgi:hypothetical protein
MKKDKRLYKGIFNYQREMITEYTRAIDREQAFRMLCIRIGVAKEKTAYSIRQYFIAKPNSYLITEVREEVKKDGQDDRHASEEPKSGDREVGEGEWQPSIPSRSFK